MGGEFNGFWPLSYFRHVNLCQEQLDGSLETKLCLTPIFTNRQVTIRIEFQPTPHSQIVNTVSFGGSVSLSIG